MASKKEFFLRSALTFAVKPTQPHLY